MEELANTRDHLSRLLRLVRGEKRRGEERRGKEMGDGDGEKGVEGICGRWEIGDKGERGDSVE